MYEIVSIFFNHAVIMLQIKLKLCGPLTVVVNVFKCLRFKIIAFTSQT